MKKIFVFVLLILSISIGVYSQLTIDDLDISKIPQRKIHDYINMQRERDIYLLSDFKASCFSGMHLPGFISMKNNFLVKENSDSLWYVYRNTNVSDLWKGKRFSFGLLYSKWPDKVCYNDEYGSSVVDTGQVCFINLRLLRGAINLAVGFEVVSINDNNKTITFRYLEGNKSLGEQIIQLLDTPEGYTKIIHISNFKSDNPFRDKFLYPYFHAQVIKEFHRNMSKLATNKKGIFKVKRKSINVISD